MRKQPTPLFSVKIVLVSSISELFLQRFPVLLIKGWYFLHYLFICAYWIPVTIYSLHLNLKEGRMLQAGRLLDSLDRNQHYMDLYQSKQSLLRFVDNP